MSTKMNTSMTIRMNRDVKQQSQQILAHLGLNMTTAVNLFLHQVILCHGMPFDVTLEAETPNDLTRIAMEDAMNARDVHGPFGSIRALLDDLDA